jgi:hypothetical protein
MESIANESEWTSEYPAVLTIYGHIPGILYGWSISYDRFEYGVYDLFPRQDFDEVTRFLKLSYPHLDSLIPDNLQAISPETWRDGLDVLFSGEMFVEIWAPNQGSYELVGGIDSNDKCYRCTSPEMYLWDNKHLVIYSRGDRPFLIIVKELEEDMRGEMMEGIDNSGDIWNNEDEDLAIAIRSSLQVSQDKKEKITIRKQRWL